MMLKFERNQKFEKITNEMMNFEKRTLAKANEIKRSMEETDESVGLESFSRIVPDRERLFAEYDQMPRYSDLDVNGHVNNTVYADICENVSPFDHNEYKVKTVMIVYKREIRLDTPMKIAVYKNDDNYIVETSDKSTNEMLFQAQIFLLKK